MRNFVSALRLLALGLSSVSHSNDTRPQIDTILIQIEMDSGGDRIQDPWVLRRMLSLRATVHYPTRPFIPHSHSTHRQREKSQRSVSPPRDEEKDYGHL